MNNTITNPGTKITNHLHKLKKQFIELEKHHMNDLQLAHQEKRVELSKLEYLMKASLRWQLGSLFIVNAKRFINLIKNPLRFFSDVDYRTVERIRPVKPGDTSNPQFNLGSPRSNLESEILKSIDDLLISLNINSKPADNTTLTQTTGGKLKVAAILDEFTNACLQPELDIVSFKTDNWKETLKANIPDVLFIESAWHGNMGSWQYRIAKYQKNMGDELLDLLEWARDNGVPSIFWNKEDPPNFDRFIDKAKLFDYIFTSDENCIPLYKKNIQHQRIYSLPFAAQPKIHNPLVHLDREFNVCFAGTYHSDEYYERRNDMEILLKPSMDFDLHIYDRNFGATAPGSERFRFPAVYQKHIKGRLNYEDMLKAYRQYKVFLNVNSVKDSPSMFSRRVFELLACGTPVISTYSKGIVDLLGDSVFISESEQDTKKHLDLLLNDSLAWMKASVKGIRTVLSNHTYANRIKYVMKKAGIPYSVNKPPKICILAFFQTNEQLNKLAKSIKKQVFQPIAIGLISDHKLSSNELERFKNKFKHIRVFNLEISQNPLHTNIQDNSDADYFSVFIANDYYGPDYLKDYSLATLYSDQMCYGKSAYYSFSNSQLSLNNPNKQYRLSHKIPMGSLMFNKAFLSSFNIIELNNEDGEFKTFTPEIVSLDPLNYIRNKSNSDISESHIRAVTG
jgi:spore maturation protein CgeB